ncbi:MAG: hypothetical protein ABSA17_08290 [Rhabdochlamydiaceae bacterium]
MARFSSKTSLKVYPSHYEKETEWIELEYLVKDLLPGDVFEVQSSKRRISPFFTKFLNRDIKLYRHQSYALNSYRLIASPLHILNVKSLNTEETMKVQNLSSNLREWSIQPKPLKRSWGDPEPHIFISEYPSWKAVVDEVLLALNVATEFTNNPSKEAQKLAAEWMDQSKDPHEQARLAVRFIQNEFNAFPHSITKYHMNDLNTVLEERDGDIYGKALLLQGLLKLMGISSTPILTQYYHNFIQNSLPQHKGFDSVILRIDFAEMSLYLDPNAEKQVGPLESNILSESHDYKIGLPLSADTTDLIALQPSQLNHPTKIVTKISPIDLDHIEIRTETILYGPKASELRNRNRYDEGNIERVSKEKLRHLNFYYSGSKIIEPFQLVDNEKLNTVTTIESYSVPLKYQKGFAFKPEIFNIFSFYRLDEEQQTPYSLRFPEWVQQEVHIEFPESLRTPFFDEIKHEHDCLYYHYIRSGNEKSEDLFIELKYLQKEVDPSQVRSYNKLVGIINNNNGYVQFLR